MTTTPDPIPAAPASTEQIQKDLADARLAAKKIRRVAAYATFDAWTIAIFAALSFVCGLFSGVSGVVIGMAMAVIAYIEFTGAARIRRLEPTAVKTLGYNQLAFGGLLILYGIWAVRSDAMSTGISPDLAQIVGSAGDTGNLEQMITWSLYALVIGIPAIAMGGTALFYFSREKHIRQYVQTTAPWIVEMQRSGGPL